MSDAVQKIRMVIERERKWVANIAAHNLQRDQPDFDYAEEKRGIRGLQRARLGLSSFATVYGTRGVVSLANGANGWSDVDRSILYRLWQFRIEAHLWKKVGWATNLAFDFPQIAGLVSYGIVCDSEINAECVHYLTEEYFGEGWDEFWPHRRYEPFVLWLDGMSRGLAADREIVKNPPFDAVIDGWQLSPQEFGKRLLDVCDYHCDNMQDEDEERSEFWHAPFNLIPWEVLAICRVRHQLGLPVPQIDHPILFLVKDFFPACTRQRLVTTDEVIEKVEAVFYECM